MWPILRLTNLFRFYSKVDKNTPGHIKYQPAFLCKLAPFSWHIFLQLTYHRAPPQSSPYPQGVVLYCGGGDQERTPLPLLSCCVRVKKLKTNSKPHHYQVLQAPLPHPLHSTGGYFCC